MKKPVLWLVLFLFLVNFASPLLAQENWEKAFAFIVAVDMREYATEPYRTSQHFWGACEAIKKVGKGAFMVSPGDIDPPHAVREVISLVLGADYPWYPVVGNHELESTSHLDYLREYNKDGESLPNIIRKGPQGCEETTYSFEWDNCHFVVLNQYYDGKSDTGTDGDIVPELLAWLEEDLAANTKKHVFVFGHEPIIAVPDMDNGRIRHQGDSLDKYSKNSFRFHQLLLKYGVTAYICGHTHNTSFCKINGLWQIDAGHARGIEGKPAPEQLFEALTRASQEGKKRSLGEQQAIAEYYETQKKNIDRWLTSMALTGKPVVQTLSQFYLDYQQGGEAKEKYFQAFWENSGYARSTFLKIYAGKEEVKVEIYRDDGRGGIYSLRHTEILD
ncbi:MAG: metallophosphoesterase [candidate division KSB1 bacterium]|nr:metallophosphoesterase [candidate division KSB1 bacterium]